MGKYSFLLNTFASYLSLFETLLYFNLAQILSFSNINVPYLLFFRCFFIVASPHHLLAFIWNPSYALIADSTLTLSFAFSWLTSLLLEFYWAFVVLLFGELLLGFLLIVLRCLPRFARCLCWKENLLDLLLLVWML